MSETEVRDFEQEARAQGWKPQEEYQGENWVDAKTFVERGDKYVGIMKDKMSRLERKLQYQETLNQDFKKHIERQEALHLKEMDNLIKRLEKERTVAVTNGDGEAFARADAQLTEAKNNKTNAEIQRTVVQERQPEWVETWLGENEWYSKDKAARAVADQYARELRDAQPSLQGPEFMQKVTEYVKTELPQKFENKKKQTAPPVEIDGGVRNAPPVDHSYASLPKEAKDTFNRFVREGIYKNNDEARARYAQMYNE